MIVQFKYEELNIKNWDEYDAEIEVLRHLQRQGYNAIKIRKRKGEIQKLRNMVLKFLMKGSSYNIPQDDLMSDISTLISNRNGVPDLFYYRDYNDFGFIEVKFQEDTLNRNQLAWISKFSEMISKYTVYLNPKILPLITIYYVFPYN